MNRHELTNKVEKGKALERLLNNSDFKEIVLEGYLKEYPLDLVLNGSNISNRHEILDSIGFFKQYLDIVACDAESALQELLGNEESNHE